MSRLFKMSGFNYMETIYCKVVSESFSKKGDKQTDTKRTQSCTTGANLLKR